MDVFKLENNLLLEEENCIFHWRLSLHTDFILNVKKNSLGFSILSVLVVTVDTFCHVLLFYQLLEFRFFAEKYYKPPQGCILFEVVIALTQ